MKLLDAIDNLKTSPQKRGKREKGARAPHKPLLLLYALARQIQNPDAKFEFSLVEKPLENLLNEFWKPQLHGRQKVNEPFWRLQKDKIWEVCDGHGIKLPDSASITVTKLRNHNAVGHFTSDIIEEIKDNPHVVRRATQKLLDRYFPESLHRDILERVRLDYEPVSVEEGKTKKPKRDAKYGFKEPELVLT